jgi:beta-lactamase regulating signal transducer with metallopeptidase domain
MSLAFALLLDASLKAAMLCLIVLAAASLCRTAAVRHDLRLAALAGCALLPFVSAATWLLAPERGAAPVHEAIVALTPSLPSAAPPRAVELVDRIWSGDGGGEAFGRTATVLVLLWTAGFLVELLRSLAAWRGAAALARRARRCTFAGGGSGFDVRVSDALSAPAVFGIRAPTVLLPAEASEWPRGRLDAVMAHEGAHVRRRDGAAELVVQLACALHWFNPLVRAAATVLRRDRELACDELVVGGGFDPRCYAAALVEVARRARPMRPSPLLAMSAMPELERRVRRLLEARIGKRGGKTARIALIGPPVLLFLAAAAFSAPAAGVLAPGSVQPRNGLLTGLDDPRSERLPFDYASAAPAAAALPAAGRDAAAIGALQAELGRVPDGYGDLVRERAIWTLSQVRDGRLFEPLADRIGDGDWRVRAYSAWGLAATGDRRATPLLVALLDDPVWRVRAMATAALAEIADPAAADAVAALANDPAWQVRAAALEYLEHVPDPALARRLRPLLADRHPGTRYFAQDVFSRF